MGLGILVARDDNDRWSFILSDRLDTLTGIYEMMQGKSKREMKVMPVGDDAELDRLRRDKEYLNEWLKYSR
jgi:hypothetical protein